MSATGKTCADCRVPCNYLDVMQHEHDPHKLEACEEIDRFNAIADGDREALRLWCAEYCGKVEDDDCDGEIKDEKAPRGRLLCPVSGYRKTGGKQ